MPGPPEGQKNWESYSTPNLNLNQQILGELKYLNWQILGLLQHPQFRPPCTRYCFIRNSTQIFRRFKEPVLNFWVIRNKITKSIGEMSLILLKLLFLEIFKERVLLILELRNTSIQKIWNFKEHRVLEI